jgi:hypothetical protein
MTASEDARRALRGKKANWGDQRFVTCVAGVSRHSSFPGLENSVLERVHVCSSGFCWSQGGFRQNSLIFFPRVSHATDHLMTATHD